MRRCIEKDDHRKTARHAETTTSQGTYCIFIQSSAVELDPSSPSSPTPPSTTPRARPAAPSKRNSVGGRGIGSTEGIGICHSYAPDGRCISLLKILLTNFCTYDCLYCVNRVSSNVPRARFTVDEVVHLTLDFYRRNCIEGLFLSSRHHPQPRLHDGAGGRGGARAARGPRLPRLHPPEDHSRRQRPSCWQRAGRYADRLSINIELPTVAGPGSAGAGKGRRRPSAARWRGCACTSTRPRTRARAAAGARRSRTSAPRRAAAPRFAPAGQSTQMIVGADATDDRTILGDQRHAVRRLSAASASTTRPSARSPTRRAALPLQRAAAGARAPALPGRLADALLRLRARRDRRRPTTACCRWRSTPSSPGRWRTASAFRST